MKKIPCFENKSSIEDKKKKVLPYFLTHRMFHDILNNIYLHKNQRSVGSTFVIPNPFRLQNALEYKKKVEGLNGTQI